MEIIVLLLAVFIAWIVLTEFMWWVIERMRPLEYRGLNFHEIKDHFEELHRRGFKGSQMVVTDERSGKSVRLRKFFRLGYDEIYLDVFADQVERGDNISPDALKAFQDCGIQCRWGIPSERLGFSEKASQRFRKNLVCPCGGSLDLAVKATHIILKKIYELPDDVEFKVRAKGAISGHDEVINGKMKIGEASYVGPLARPYKQFQKPGGLFYWSGRLLGAICREIRDWLFPSSGSNGRLGL